MEYQRIQKGSEIYISMKPKTGKMRTEKLFSYEEMPGFLPLEVRLVNGEKEYCYPISGKITLRQYLTETAFHLSDIQALFFSLLDMMQLLEEYLLDSRGLMIGEEVLFVDVRTHQIYGIYGEEDGEELIPAMSRLLEFIMEKMNQKEKDLVFFVYGMHKQTKETNCSVQDLRQYLCSEEVYTEKVYAVEERKQKTNSDLWCRSKKESGCWQRKREKTVADFWYVLAAVIVVCAAGCLLFLWRRGVFYEAGTRTMDYRKLLGILLFFGTAGGYGVWRLCLLKKERGELLLSKEEQKKVCLIPREKGDEWIPVSTFPFRLGKREDLVNYVLFSENISDFHAEIRQEGGYITLVDEESDGGTYWNGKQLAAWQPVQLQDGDRIRFAEYEYVVEITKS